MTTSVDILSIKLQEVPGIWTFTASCNWGDHQLSAFSVPYRAVPSITYEPPLTYQRPNFFVDRLQELVDRLVLSHFDGNDRTPPVQNGKVELAGH